MNHVNIIGKVTMTPAPGKVDDNDVAIFEITTKETRIGRGDAVVSVETPVAVYCWGKFKAIALEILVDGMDAAIEGTLRYVDVVVTDDEGDLVTSREYIVEIKDLIIL